MHLHSNRCSPGVNDFKSIFLPYVSPNLFSGLDYLEVGHPDGIFDIQGYNFCKEKGLGVLSGSDMHKPDFVYGWTTLKPSNFSEEAILAELRSRRSSVILNAIESPYKAPIPKFEEHYGWLDPFYKVGDLFKSYFQPAQGMYSFTNTPSGSGIFCYKSQPFVEVRGVVMMFFTIVFIFLIVEVSIFFEIDSHLPHVCSCSAFSVLGLSKKREKN
jgi:hypothetical protein